MDFNNPLSEDKFIQNEQNPFPKWMWLLILALIAALGWGGISWYMEKMNEQFRSEPFLQVTNREMSIFLWQFPEKMRANVKNKSGYLPAFQASRVQMDPKLADRFAVGPPELLFTYHTWKRLLEKEFTPRPIPKKEFEEFLDKNQEWMPAYWSEAPEGYIDLVNGLPNLTSDNLSNLSTSQLPREVREAFQGWKNFYKEGQEINALKLTYEQVEDFVRSHPHYARNYWRNLLLKTRPDYLLAFSKGTATGSDPVPDTQMAPFLKVALFNYLQAREGK